MLFIGLSPTNQDILGGGLLYLVMHLALSISPSVTDRCSPGFTVAPSDWIEMEDGGTIEGKITLQKKLHAFHYVS